MEILMSCIIGLLFAVGTYLLLSKSILRIILGTVILSHGAHLLLLTMSKLKRGAPPLLGENAVSYTDPLPQALILTSIVISFGVTALILVIAFRAYQTLGTDDMEQMKGQDKDE